jgi:hypothetical protein
VPRTAEAGAGAGGEHHGDDRRRVGAGGHVESLAAIGMPRGPHDRCVSNVSDT